MDQWTWMHFHRTPGQASCDKSSEAPDGDRSVALHRWRAIRRETMHMNEEKEWEIEERRHTENEHEREDST